MPSDIENRFKQIKGTELSAILFKDSSKMASQLERDAGFCSGGSDIGDDYQSERIQSSPSSTDTSEDSVDIKLCAITIPTKRKTFDVVKYENDIPLKKRFKFETVFTNSTDKMGNLNVALQNESSSHAVSFRPWNSAKTVENDMPDEAEVLVRHPGVTTLHPVCHDEQPLALVKRKSNPTTTTNETNTTNENVCTEEIAIKIDETDEADIRPQPLNDDLKSNSRSTLQRNYKNMTRERRIEANARERTRVHTISAAFDTLRQAIPSYSNTQKLSKLSILRVACAYILTLSRMTGLDYSADQSAPSIQSCIEEITKTIQTEGKTRKRKDE